jgi:flagellar hook-basal body complex protein FliE
LAISSVDSVMAVRNAILQRNAALDKAATAPAPAPISGVEGTRPASFGSVFTDAIQKVNAVNSKAGALTVAYERGEETDIAKVMLARQASSIGFEATLQVRNKLLSAYKDIMSMSI